MASSGGHILVPQAMRLLRHAWTKASRAIRDKLPQTTRTIETQLQPSYARVARQPVNRLAAIKQSQSRWYSTRQAINNTIRKFSSNAAPRTRASYPTSRTAAAVGRLNIRTPFASQLRPNLTGGTLCRSAGGYGLGGGRAGARYFSHSPAAPAQVVNNVSQAVRAFWLSGSKAQFDGFNQRTGEKRFRAVSDLQDEVRQRMDMSSAYAKGSFIDFKVSPTITALGPLANIPRVAEDSSCEPESDTLNNTALMSNLAVDFARALKDLAAIMNDLKRLSTLGDLPIMLENGTTLRVRFPGCDSDTVEGLCRELNLRRGIVGQDEGFDVMIGTEMALLFPFAPSRAVSEAEVPSRPIKRLKRDKVDWQQMVSLANTASPGYSQQSATSHEFVQVDRELGENPWLSSPSGYSSLHASEMERDDVAMYFEPRHDEYCSHMSRSRADVTGYEGLEGVHRFLQECDRAKC